MTQQTTDQQGMTEEGMAGVLVKPEEGRDLAERETQVALDKIDILETQAIMAQIAGQSLNFEAGRYHYKFEISDNTVTGIGVRGTNAAARAFVQYGFGNKSDMVLEMRETADAWTAVKRYRYDYAGGGTWEFQEEYTQLKKVGKWENKHARTIADHKCDRNADAKAIPEPLLLAAQLAEAEQIFYDAALRKLMGDGKIKLPTPTEREELKKPKSTDVENPQAKPDNKEPDQREGGTASKTYRAITEPQQKRLWAKLHTAGLSEEELKTHLLIHYERQEIADIAMGEEYKAICAWIDAGGKEPEGEGQ